MSQKVLRSNTAKTTNAPIAQALAIIAPRESESEDDAATRKPIIGMNTITRGLVFVPSAMPKPSTELTPANAPAMLLLFIVVRVAHPTLFMWFKRGFTPPQPR
jgi:hypothetical protein